MILMGDQRVRQRPANLSGTRGVFEVWPEQLYFAHT
jgi:hypothetical protein